ncbi:MAG: hypothetical protein II781_04520, partial [Clostridia bacterium]|nr:hypothetical protein [Clostridia bacterium]
MKRLFTLFLCVLFLLTLLPAAALAEGEAENLTAKCTITASELQGRVSRMLDDSVATGWAPENANANLTIESKTPISYLYIQYLTEPQHSYIVSVSQDGSSYTPAVMAARYRFLDELITLPEPANFVQLNVGKNGEAVTGLAVYGEGTFPSNLPAWQPTAEKCDIMVLSAHPDDD